MSLELWQPLSTRESTEDAVLRAGLPRPLETQLRWWIEKASRRLDRTDRIVLRCDLPHPLECEEHEEPEADAAEDRRPWEHLAYCTPAERLLDVVDAWLSLTVPRPLDKRTDGAFAFALAKMMPEHTLRETLQEMLDDARSAYTLRPDHSGLMHRVAPATQHLVSRALAASAQEAHRGSASRHLYAALVAAYGLQPDPVRAYSEAIKAVESAAHATLEPKNGKATLGTMVRVLRSGQAKFAFRLGDGQGEKGLDAVEAMIVALWSGQTSRHGGSQPTRPETVEEARTAVDLAAGLVQIFASGALFVPPIGP